MTREAYAADAKSAPHKSKMSVDLRGLLGMTTGSVLLNKVANQLEGSVYSKPYTPESR
jgi:hypothetical protein